MGFRCYEIIRNVHGNLIDGVYTQCRCTTGAENQRKSS